MTRTSVTRRGLLTRAVKAGGAIGMVGIVGSLLDACGSSNNNTPAATSASTSGSSSGSGSTTATSASTTAAGSPAATTAATSDCDQLVWLDRQHRHECHAHHSAHQQSDAEPDHASGRSVVDSVE